MRESEKGLPSIEYVFVYLVKRRKQPIASVAFNLACHTHPHTIGQTVMFIGERKILLREGQTVK